MRIRSIFDQTGPHKERMERCYNQRREKAEHRHPQVTCEPKIPVFDLSDASDRPIYVIGTKCVD